MMPKYFKIISTVIQIDDNTYIVMIMCIYIYIYIYAPILREIKIKIFFYTNRIGKMRLLTKNVQSILNVTFIVHCV